jgi:tetratricopeptide (TPR) repeat protein
MGPVLRAAPLLAAVTVLAVISGQAGDCGTAMQMFHDKRWSEAAAGFGECEKKDPGKTDALLFRGKSLVNLQRYDEAAAALQDYARSHPQSDDAVYLLAYISFRKDKPQESLHLFSAAARIKPPSANDLTIVALDYVLLSDYNDAAHYLEQALKMKPDDLEARYHLGRVRYQQNRFDAAIEAFQLVLRQDPTNVKAEDNLGLSLEAKNEVEQAVNVYKKAIELDQAAVSHSEQPYLNLGSLLAKSNRLDEGIPFMLRAAEIAPNEFKVHYELSKAYFDSGQFMRAREQAEMAVKLNSKDSSGHYLLGRVYQRLERKDLANEQFQITSRLLHDRDANSQTGMSSSTTSH